MMTMTMTMTTTGRVMTFVAALLLASAITSQARPHEEIEGAGIQHMLGLSADQATSWTQENEAYRAKIESLFARRRDAGEAVERAANRNALGQALLAAWDVDQEISVERKAHNERLKALLTPEQAERLSLMREMAEVVGRGPGASEEALLGGERPHRGVPGGRTLKHEQGEIGGMREHKREQ